MTMLLAAEFQQYLHPDFWNLIHDQNAETLESLKNEFQKTRFIHFPQFLSTWGLETLRAQVNALQKEEKPYHQQHASIMTVDSLKIQNLPFVQLILHAEAFLNLLKKVTTINTLEVRWKKPANINIFRYPNQNYAWHYDGPFISVIACLEAPRQGNGGEFAYYSKLRPAKKNIINVIYTEIYRRLGFHRLFKKKVLFRNVPGGLIFFDGDTTYHRVAPLKDNDLRRVLCFAYEKRL